MSAIAHTRMAESNQLARLCRALAAVMPAVLIGYSALVDPLINYDLAQGFDYGGVEVGYESKSKTLTQLVMPMFLALSVVLAVLARPVVPRRLRLLLVPSGGLLALASLSALWATAPNATLTLAAYQAILFLSLLTFVAVANDPPRILRHVVLMFALVVAFNLVTVLIRPPGSLGHQGIYDHKNTLGSAAGCAFLFGLFGITGQRLAWRALSWFTAGGALVLVIVSDSKTAAALVIAAPVFALSIYAVTSLLALRPLIVISLLAAVAVSGCYVASRLLGFEVDDILLATYGDTTFTGRTEIWSFVGSHIREAPVLGHGFRGFWSLGAASPKHASEVEFIRTIGSSHNGFLDMALDLGIVGLALLVVFIVLAFGTAANFAMRPANRSLLYLAMIVFLIGRNAMESIIMWSSFFDNLSFLLVSFLACYREPVRRIFVGVVQPSPKGLATARAA